MALSSLSSNPVDVIDIRSPFAKHSLADAVYQGLESTPPTLPTMLLYDVQGLQLFEEITYLDEYYLTNAEIEALTAHAKTIAEIIPKYAQLVELGSGNLRKIEILLKEFETAQKSVDYYALDLSLDELNRTFATVSPETYCYVRLHGLHGTYDDALRWLQDQKKWGKTTCVLSLGSSLGNFNHGNAAKFLHNFVKLLEPPDSFIVGLDGCKTEDKVYLAYNDPRGLTRQFYMNGLAHANKILGFEAFKSGEWEVHSLYNKDLGCHQAFYVPTCDVEIKDIKLRQGERILFEEAYKFDETERFHLWRNAGLVPTRELGNSSNDYHLHVLRPAKIDMPRIVVQYWTGVAPPPKNWEMLWLAWDIVSKSMVPREALMSRPIELRNPLIFYLGHIPTFCDIHLARGTKSAPTEPKEYRRIFERGIDPDVDNPEKCHPHSELPDDWPPLADILDFQERVRARLLSILRSTGYWKNRLLSEAIWIAFEHEVMHIETFLYMLLQSDKVLPPPGVPRPNFERMALDARRDAKPNRWFRIPEQTLTIGIDDSDIRLMPEKAFGWDNEKPRRVVTVRPFEAQGRAVTNGEYGRYLVDSGSRQVPASWIATASVSSGSNGDANGHPSIFDKYSVRTVFGPVPLKWAADWPVMASYDELDGYAKWMNCRLPTYEEAQSIYKHAEFLKQQRGVADFLRRRNGAHASYTESFDEKDPNIEVTMFRDLESCNVGFKKWHPTPVTPYGDKLAGQSELGGVWEWTSTILAPHEGFHPMEAYPGYTTDFFDGKHNIVLGGSWATHPRIAGRTTFINFYQHNYPYAWVGARLVRDI